MASVHMLGEWDPHYIASVLAEILSRETGRDVQITLTPKTEEKTEVSN